jgi:hypothetical protein
MAYQIKCFSPNLAIQYGMLINWCLSLRGYLLPALLPASLKGAPAWEFWARVFYCNRSHLGRWLGDWRKKYFFFHLFAPDFDVFFCLQHVEGVRQKIFRLGQNLKLVWVAFGPIYMLIMYFYKNFKVLVCLWTFKTKIKVHFFSKHSARRKYFFANTQLVGNTGNFCRCISSLEIIFSNT